jgi:hypothetical protein
VSVQNIEQELLSGKYGIPEGYDIDCLLHQLGHILQISDGMVYPVHNKTSPYRPLMRDQVTGNKTSNMYNSQTYGFIPAGSEGEIKVSNQSCAVNVVNESSAKKNEDDIAEARYKQAKVTEIVENSFVSTKRPLTFDTAEDEYKKS